MNTFNRSLTLVFCLCLTSYASAQAVDPYLPDFTSPATVSGMKLVWNDEFNTDGVPNTANWKPETGFVRNQELEYYQLSNATCKNGVLLITGKRDTVVNAKYVRGSTDWRYKDSLAYWTSASMITQGLKSFQYGRIDVRARIDTTYGAWPAIWQKGVTGSWPACGETDIMEFYNKKIYANVIYGAIGSANYSKCIYKSFAAVAGSDANWVQKFHLWTEIWTADSIKLYLDGMLMNSVLVNNIANPAGTTPANGFLQPHFFQLNLAIGSNGGTPRNSTSQITYEVDYIRVYQASSTGFVSPSFDPVQLAPNPAADKMGLISEQKPSMLLIRDLTGRSILRLSHPESVIDVSSFPPGNYIVQLYFPDRPAVSLKMIKLR